MSTSQTSRRDGPNAGAAIKVACRVTTTAAITLSALQTINGVVLVADDRVLVKNQSNTTTNGIYIASSSTWQRSDDFDGNLDVVPGTLIFVNEGTANSDTLWQVVCPDDPAVIGTSEITFSIINASAENVNLNALAGLTGAADKVPYFTGAGAMTVADFTSYGRSLVDDANAAAARSTLGLGTAAIVNTGIDPSNVPLVSQLGSVLAIIGAVFSFATSTVPSGFLECNGAAVSRTTYSALFAIISTTWGAGNGSTTFNVPDLRGEFIRGWDNGRGVDIGRAFASFQDHAAESHRHLKGEATTIETPDGNYNANGQTINGTIYGTGNQSGDGGYSSNTSSVQVPTTNGGTVKVASENRPRNYAFMYCIKF